MKKYISYKYEGHVPYMGKDQYRVEVYETCNGGCRPSSMAKATAIRFLMRHITEAEYFGSSCLIEKAILKELKETGKLPTVILV